MCLKEIELINFRNFTYLKKLIPEQGILITGRNGSGKSNFIESIYFLFTGKSSRTFTKKELISFGADYCTINGIIVDDNFDTIELSISFDQKMNSTLKKNGHKIKSLSQWFGMVNIISFSPSDINIINGSPHLRRRYLDMTISQYDDEYLQNLILYNKLLSNRNNLILKNILDEQLDFFDEQISFIGASICYKRNKLIKLLLPYLSRFYSELSGNEDFVSIEYKPSICNNSDSQKQWENVFLTKLKLSRKNDVLFGYTTVGPHRDDIQFYIDTKPAIKYASQGQCRSLVFALRLAAMECIENFKHQNKIFLLDDVFSELDHQSASKILPLIEGKGQIFIATAMEHHFFRNLTRWEITNGTVKEL